MTTTFDFFAVARDHLRECSSPDPHVCARHVRGLIPAKHVGAVLDLLLPEAMREAIHRQRGSAPSDSANGKRAMGDMTHDPRRLRRFVPGAGWRFEADMTTDDCDAAADFYFGQAQANERMGKRFRWLADELRRRGVERVGDLPAEAWGEVDAA